MFLALLPSIFSLFTSMVGPFLSHEVQQHITATVAAAGDSLTKTGLIKAITDSVGEVEQTKLDEFSKQLDILMDAQQNQAFEDSPEGLFYKGWRPFVCWGVSILVIIHLTIAEIYNLVQLYHGHNLMPLDSLTVILMTSVLGIYMTGRTVEKINK